MNRGKSKVADHEGLGIPPAINVIIAMDFVVDVIVLISIINTIVAVITVTIVNNSFYYMASSASGQYAANSVF